MEVSLVPAPKACRTEGGESNMTVTGHVGTNIMQLYKKLLFSEIIF